MLTRYFAICALSILFLVSACSTNLGMRPESQDVVLSINDDVLAVSPVSISSAGDKLQISELDINLLSEQSGVKPESFRKIGVVPGEYSQIKLKELRTALNTDFENYYLDFYRSIVLPATNISETSGNRDINERLLQVLRGDFIDKLSRFLSNFGSDVSHENCITTFDSANQEKSSSANSSRNVQELLSCLESTQKLAFKIRKAKHQVDDWLEVQIDNFKFTRSLSITIDIASQNGHTVLPAKRAFATIFGEKHFLLSTRFSLKETQRHCRKNLTACRVVLVHVLDDSSSEVLKDLVDSFRLIHVQKHTGIFNKYKTESANGDYIRVRELVDTLSIDMELLINGREANLTLPGRFMKVTDWGDHQEIIDEFVF